MMTSFSLFEGADKEGFAMTSQYQTQGDQFNPPKSENQNVQSGQFQQEQYPQSGHFQQEQYSQQGGDWQGQREGGMNIWQSSENGKLGYPWSVKSSESYYNGPKSNSQLR